MLITWSIAFVFYKGSSGTCSIPEHCPDLEQTESTSNDIARICFANCNLDGKVDFEVFKKAIDGVDLFRPAKKIIAICDFTKPSTAERLFIVDLQKMKLLAKSLVAHGRNSGELMATSFSNQMNSYKSSLGFFQIGQKIKSPKHGDALLLEGLEKGLNDQARKREIIIHSADYVSDHFVKKNGRLGRSHGCPAVPAKVLQNIIPLLKDGALLYIHGNSSANSRS
ncbi:MAG: murein L,D-transpeptidase catalytic domain family protein [Saprospiraceae bacterium]|nr:murein L,D-transpeptidase catalytic domain family protein [Saprospiraceae bacterium]